MISVRIDLSGIMITIAERNGNRILLRFDPKGTDIGKLTDRELQRIEDWVNDYPRKIFDYKTANEIAA